MRTSAARGNPLGLLAAIVLIPLGLWAHDGSSRADEPGANSEHDRSRADRLSLADLAGYRAALAGKPVADDARPADPPVPVQFRDLWDHPGTFQGRRVTIQGRVERLFRQGPVGSFPPLVEAWLFSTAGDPYCVVFPLPSATIENGRERPGSVSAVGADGRPPHATAPAVPDPGRRVRFTGTFLKMIRYLGGDGERLVPMVVGDRPPQSAPVEAAGDRSAAPARDQIRQGLGGPGFGGSTGSSAGWVLSLALALLAAGMIARQHLRGPGRHNRSAMIDRNLEERGAEPVLRFVDSPDQALPENAQGPRRGHQASQDPFPHAGAGMIPDSHVPSSVLDR